MAAGLLRILSTMIGKITQTLNGIDKMRKENAKKKDEKKKRRKVRGKKREKRDESFGSESSDTEKPKFYP